MVELFSFLRWIQNLSLPSFLRTRTTVLAHGLYDFQIAPISSIFSDSTNIQHLLDMGPHIIIQVGPT